MKSILFVLFALFSSGATAATFTDPEIETECTGRSFAFDFQNDFQSDQGGFDWCFKRVQWWGLNTSDGWRGRYCSSRRYSIGYNQWRWSNHFRHQFHEYRSQRGSYDHFNFFSRFYSQRVFRGFPGRIEFTFDSDCRSLDDYD